MFDLLDLISVFIWTQMVICLLEQWLHHGGKGHHLPHTFTTNSPSKRAGASWAFPLPVTTCQRPLLCADLVQTTVAVARWPQPNSCVVSRRLLFANSPHPLAPTFSQAPLHQCSPSPVREGQSCEAGNSHPRRASSSHSLFSKGFILGLHLAIALLHLGLPAFILVFKGDISFLLGKI